jgi:hypothetical protein
VGHAPPPTSVTSRSAAPDPFFAGGPYLPADDVDDMQHQHYMAIEHPGPNLATETVVAYVPPQISVTPGPLYLPDPPLARGPYLHADEVDDDRHLHHMALECLTEFQGRGPRHTHL